jgi:hypothetical protein
MKLRHALVGLAVLTVAPVSDCTGEARAAPSGACGGPGNVHHIAPGGQVVCQNTRRLQDGQDWLATVIINADGTWQVHFHRPVAPDAPVFLEVELHYGKSGDGGYTFTGTLPAGDDFVSMAGSIPLTEYAAFGCYTQVDVKAVNGERDTANNRVRIAGPHFQFAPELCQSSPVTTASTSPTTAPGTSPTTATVSSTVPGSTVPGATIPATGGRAAAPYLLVGGVMVAAGLVILVATRKRAT